MTNEYLKKIINCDLKVCRIVVCIFNCLHCSTTHHNHLNKSYNEKSINHLSILSLIQSAVAGRAAQVKKSLPLPSCLIQHIRGTLWSSQASWLFWDYPRAHFRKDMPGAPWPHWLSFQIKSKLHGEFFLKRVDMNSCLCRETTSPKSSLLDLHWTTASNTTNHNSSWKKWAFCNKQFKKWNTVIYIKCVNVILIM